MEAFLSLVVLSMLIEAIVNLVKNIKEQETNWKYWASLVVGLVVGVAVTVNWDIDVFRMLGLPVGRVPFLGSVLTGILLSRGSNFVSDLIGRINLPKQLQQ